MKSRHKSKTLSCLLAVLAGWLGGHRFYLYGRKDLFGWLYLSASTIYFSLFALALQTASFALGVAVLFPVPVYAAAVEALSIGLTNDTQWDQRHNLHTPARSASGWPLVILLVLTLAVTFTGFVASMARATDLLYTGGSFG